MVKTAGARFWNGKCQFCHNLVTHYSTTYICKLRNQKMERKLLPINLYDVKHDLCSHWKKYIKRIDQRLLILPHSKVEITDSGLLLPCRPFTCSQRERMNLYHRYRWACNFIFGLPYLPQYHYQTALHTINQSAILCMWTRTKTACLFLVSHVYTPFGWTPEPLHEPSLRWLQEALSIRERLECPAVKILLTLHGRRIGSMDFGCVAKNWKQIRDKNDNGKRTNIRERQCEPCTMGGTNKTVQRFHQPIRPDSEWVRLTFACFRWPPWIFQNGSTVRYNVFRPLAVVFVRRQLRLLSIRERLSGDSSPKSQFSWEDLEGRRRVQKAYIHFFVSCSLNESNIG